jgi:hypothetical protein
LIQPYLERKVPMSIAEQIYEVAKPLPESLALEVLHFIEFLSSKNADRAAITDLTRAQETVMKHVWDNQDDDLVEGRLPKASWIRATRLFSLNRDAVAGEEPFRIAPLQ